MKMNGLHCCTTLLFLVVYTFICFLPNKPAFASGEEAYIYGNNHCFYFKTPQGWIADPQAGADQGVPFIFYPAGSTWSSATTVIYAKIADKAPDLEEPKDQVAMTIRQFHTEGDSPNSKAQKVGAIESQSGDKGEMYMFTGDKWGNTELVAYFNGKNTINFFVMTSRNEKDLQKNREALEELARSYREADDCKPCDDQCTTNDRHHDNPQGTQRLPDSLEEATKLASEQEGSKATSDYFTNSLLPYYANKYQGILNQCFATTPAPDSHPFSFVVAINANGTVLRVYRDIETNIFKCINSKLATEHFPKPPVAPYFLHIEMTFAP